MLHHYNKNSNSEKKSSWKLKIKIHGNQFWRQEKKKKHYDLARK